MIAGRWREDHPGRVHGRLPGPRAVQQDARPQGTYTVKKAVGFFACRRIFPDHIDV